MVECFLWLENLPQVLSISEIQALSASEEYPNGVDFPNFLSYEEFLESDFFNRYYNLWEENISFHPDTHFLQDYSLDPTAIFVERIHRMLTILWYLDVEIFSGNTCRRTSEEPGENCEEEFPWRYFWVFGPQTDAAIRRFQTHYWLPVDGVVWSETKRNFYYVVYHKFHNTHRAICSRETQKEIKKINNQVQ